jgi:energy-coupling factor transporter ATP-binding protein EcfA2
VAQPLPAGTPAFSLGGWTFQSRPSAATRGDNPLTFHTQLTAALRAGHGARASFRISVQSGPDPVLELFPDDAPSFRWIARTLLPAYERNQWRWVPGNALHPRGRKVWVGRRARAWPEPFRFGADLVSLVDAVVLCFGSLPRGARCDWSFRPAPVTHLPWWERETAISDSPPRRAGPLISPARPPIPEPTLDRPLFWEVRTRLEGDEHLGPRAVLGVESATRSLRGNGLRFHRRHRWEGENAGRFPMTEADVVLAFPSPTCAAAGEPEPNDGREASVLPLGRTVSGRIVGPRLEPGQGRHIAVLGETGMGKSSLLVALSRRVVGTSGLILFDPIGETAQAVRAQLPPRAIDRLTWIDPSSLGGLNALEGIGSELPLDAARRERLLNDLVHSLRRVRSGRYADSSFWGPRLEEMLTRALRAAAALPEGTLVDAHSLLASGGRGFRTLPPEASEAVRELSDRIRSRPEDADGARRLLYEVTRSPILVRMLCEREPALHAADLVAPGRIVLIAGNAADVGESTARYLLSVYLALVWSQVLARTDGSKTFVVLDEAQWFVHESLSEMLRLGRRRNMHVVLATQAVASLPDAVAEAVWTNVADFVAFRGSPDEAREFSRVARGVTPESILSLPRGEAAVLLGKGNAVHWLRTTRAAGFRTQPSGVPDGVRPIDSKDTDGPPPETQRPDRLEPPGRGEASDLDAVLRVLRREVDRAGGEDPVRISLSKLRREADRSGRGVRAAGAILGRSGAIVRTGRDVHGPYWWLDRERVRGTDPPSYRAAGKTRAVPPKPS